ncbi:acetyltransferase [Campylobacter sp. RM13119]|uniref:acetyltransferase n=1 Tax=Campylobacter TaxID=194 RepID=UPI00147502FF|nr:MULTISPECIES: acetyltransferase [unclassified Campylobacter]MBE3021837.1 acetyltransferase [Campylobacter sp. 7477a]MBE3606135.1 acetyltransferase [Campylobacter sp. RM13119]MBE3609429.1 acetyltransferase [Campylobacter sp. RM12916]
MGYESFVIKDPRVAKIIENAKKFDIEALENEAMLKTLLASQKFTLSQNERDSIEEIFVKLMKIEEEIQLSK